MRTLFDQESGRNLSMRAALAGGIILVALGFALGFTMGAGAEGKGGPLGTLVPPPGVDFSPVWKAWYVIDEKFVPAAVATTTSLATSTEETNQERVWGMVQGLAESLGDPYTYFLPPVENEQFVEDLSGQFQGVGMEIAVRDQILTVVAPLKGSPAEAAGIQSGDHVLKIDGEDTRGLDITTAVGKIRGEKGTVVTLTILRDGWSEPQDIKVTRDVISVPAISTTLRSDGVFVIELASFTANAPQLFREALREFVESGSSRLVLDLRGNPGGYLEAAVDMASWFLPSGRVVVTEDYAGHAGSTEHRSRGYDVFNENLKMAILVNRGSASASEILAGALRHYGIAKLVGERTFGKGSVQELVDITSGSALKITVARWLDPSGVQIPLDGIVPDVEVSITQENIEAGDDPQLEAAAKLLLGDE
ncbi:S41 family peptidase [Candidatus Parcubacteria bacterium]|nr:MAG: S41 family peptidase [Candidatus Parcubacteria bacterium]